MNDPSPGRPWQEHPGAGLRPSSTGHGLIRRTTSRHDRRRFDVTLTPDGRRRFEQAWPAYADGIGRYFVEPLAPRDISELGRILGDLIQANQNQPG